jgi:hypothetical protein
MSYWQPATRSGSRATGRDEETGITVAWTPSDDGYTLEFSIPAATLAPADLAVGSRLGFYPVLRNDQEGLAAAFCASLGDETHLRPDLWGAIRLAGSP